MAQSNSRQPGKSTSLFNPLPSKQESTVPPGRRRASKPKVRSGCLTCKRRHVKCDEAKPGCLRCAKAELVCSGYMSDEPPEAKKPPPPAKQTRLLLPRLESQAHIVEQQQQQQQQSQQQLQPLQPQPQQQLANLPPGTYWTTPPLLSISPVPSNPFFEAPLTPDDAQYFDLFQHKLVHDLLGLSISQFWSRTVLRESTRDACIRHSLLAIGALARGLYLGPDSLTNDASLRGLPASAALQRVGNVRNADHRAALSHHTKAVSMFRARIMGSGESGEGNDFGTSPRSMLIATLLFVAYEHLQGNTEAAEQLVNRGLVLLRDSPSQFRNDEGVASQSQSQFSDTPLDDDMTEIKLLLPRLGVASILSVFCPNFYYPRSNSAFASTGGVPLGGTLTPQGLSQPRQTPLQFLPYLPSSDSALPDPATMSNERAIQLWTDTCTRVLLWVTRYARVNIGRDPHRPPPYNLTDAEIQQMNWVRQLLWWRTALTSLVDRAERNMQEIGGGDEGQLLSLRLAHIHMLICLVSASCCLDATHVVKDQYQHLMSEVVERCRILCESQAASGTSKGVAGIRFTFDVGVVPALSTIAAICRNRDVRGKAIGLLKELKWWREADWDARAHVIGLEALVELEEGGGMWVRDSQSQSMDMAAQALGSGLDGVLDGAGGGGWGRWFIPSGARYVWTAASWDLARHKMMAEYTRVLPDEQGRPVMVRMELDILNDAGEDLSSQGFGGLAGGGLSGGGLSGGSFTNMTI